MLLRWLLICCWGGLLGPSTANPSASGLGVLESDEVLAPGKPYHAQVGVGQAKFLRFSCMGGPADAVVSLSSYAENADPLLFLSVNPDGEFDRVPSFSRHDSSTFAHWLEDAAGDHYAMAKGLGPRGGILGLLNIKRFASEVLDAVLTLHCSYIIAFDTLFWDHLRSAAVCPVGHQNFEAGVPTRPFCSGHGTCQTHGQCKCDSDHTGPACEHRKYDVVVGQDFNFEVSAGHYQYFRVHIPPHFVGGYVEVKVRSSAPVVVLIRSDDLPTKTNYDLSNFDNWINHRNQTTLKFKVAPSDGIVGSPLETGYDGSSSYGLGAGSPSFGGALSDGPPTPPPLPIGDGMGLPPQGVMPGVPELGPPPPGLGRRRLKELIGSAAQASSWPDFFRALAGVQAVNATRVVPSSASLRKLSFVPASCPKLVPQLTHPLCHTAPFQQCKESCMSCLNCVQGNQDQAQCSDACQQCIAPRCTRSLAGCASDVSCAGAEAQRCEANCGSCMGCFDSNDRQCALCSCCDGCLPLSAKCMGNPASESRYVFVGIFHHRRYRGDRGVIGASADVSLTADEDFVRDGTVPKSWTADLYNPFHDLRSAEVSNNEDYPSGQQFLYDLEIRHSEVAHIEVRLYRDRLTILHLKNANQLKHMELEFLSGPAISHVLTSSKASPKTLFDFDSALEQANHKVRVHAHDRQNIWCAIFGATDGFAQITTKASSGVQESSGGNFGFSLVIVIGLLCGLMMLGVMSGGMQRLSDSLGSDAGTSITDRLMNIVRNRGTHESTASLTRVGSLQGYSGSDVIDRNVEDQYLHRGGLGDEGL